jgi:hypothetical protein
LHIGATALLPPLGLIEPQRDQRGDQHDRLRSRSSEIFSGRRGGERALAGPASRLLTSFIPESGRSDGGWILERLRLAAMGAGQ